ncbi:uncharacterized protein LOC135461586 [Liolophura sinensis]|uniref:uncharacterized protein LOC135461586 n=1 Tax=Liolophura sinensis TaxID=3198878 RepID=UPI003158E2D1
MALEKVHLGVILGVSGTAVLLLIGLVIVCCYSRRRRKATLKAKDPENQKIQNAEKDKIDGTVVEGGVDNPVKGEITEMSKSVVTSKEHSEVGTMVIVEDSENIDDLYAKVNKTKKPQHSGDGQEKDTVNTDTLKSSAHNESVGQVSDQTDVSRNSPDGAPDPSLKRLDEEPHVMVETRKSSHGEQRHVSSTSTDVVSVDEDITKLQANGQYLKVNHEISFSSEDERSSNVSKPSVAFGETRFSDDYDRLRFQTTKTATSRPRAVEREYVYDKNFYSSVNRHDTFIIPPDSSGMARVFVNSDTSTVRRFETTQQNAPQRSRVVGDHDEVFLDQSFDTLTGISGHKTMPLKSARHGDVTNQIEWTRKVHQQQRHHPTHDHMGRRYRVDLRDNVSSHTDGGYTLSEYVIPPPRYRYTSMSTLESVGRDRSHSMDEPIYYIPSRRSSMASGAYSVVASTYYPRRHVHRRYVTQGKTKIHKPLSRMDLHRLKYRSYKGSLPPFNVPL